MSKKPNTEIAKDFIAYLHGQGLEVFKETHTLSKALRHEFLYIAAAGEPGVNTSLHELGERLLPWLQANGISKSHAQLEHICQIVWSNAANRASPVPQPANPQLNPRNHIAVHSGEQQRPLHARNVSSLTRPKF